MASIDIGSAATDRGGASGTGYTLLLKDNPANATGVLSAFEAWAVTNVSGAKIGTFSGSSKTWDDRDYESIGVITSGSKQTFSGLDCDVVVGDLIGTYFSGGTWEVSTSGYSGIWYVSGDKFGTGSAVYADTGNTTSTMSLYGTGYILTQKSLTEAITLVASSLNKALKPINETTTLTPSLLNKISKEFNSQITLDDVMTAFRLLYLTVADAITLADSLSKSVFRTISDAFLQVESLGKNIYKGTTDVISVVGTYSNQIWMTLSDTATLTDSVSKSIARVLTSITSLVDSLIKSSTKVASETITVVDTFGRLIQRITSGVITLVDSVAKSTQRTISDALEILDTRQFYIRLYLEETFSFSETLAKSISKIESSSLSMDDSMAKLVNKSLTSSLGFTESIQKSVQKTVSQALTLIARALREWTHYGSSDMTNLLKDTFYLEVNTVEADSTGGHTDNWDFSRTFKGRLSRLPIKERLGNDKVTVYATHKLYCEYMTVTTADRVKLGTRYFDIVTVENPRNWNKHLELLLLEVT